MPRSSRRSSKLPHVRGQRRRSNRDAHRAHPRHPQVFDRAGLTIDDVDLIEINEAFASVVLAWARELDADLGRVNVHGGAIALGHPLGASGARLLATLLNAMEARDATLGLQVMCEAGGLANATIIERL